MKADTFSLKLSNTVKVTITEEKFFASAHNLSGCVPYQNCEVDGKIAVGSIHVPASILKNITVKTGTKEYTLDTSGMFDPALAPGGLQKRFGGFCYDENNCAFRGVFGDAGGLHAAEWVIKNGRSWRTVLSDSEDLSQFFSKNLTPPQYH